MIRCLENSHRFALGETAETVLIGKKSGGVGRYWYT